MRILIVDDETLARDRLRRMIESDGQHEVVGDVATGRAAVKVCEKLRPDLCLLDIRMPGMERTINARPPPPSAAPFRMGQSREGHSCSHLLGLEPICWPYQRC